MMVVRVLVCVMVGGAYDCLYVIIDMAEAR